ncbi:DUF4870 domain-containing protein [Salimicrobium salexigens]|uniref:Uncharacterized membrane protein n=1 Tax=Salimicrobium salexigens TaxID=908941 RepID=A0ABY1KWJ1_9BACI|nr:DUF4870 domain-containing protein [Salimicrobium salexigens]SIS86091.1 Uncharacterized membrane protein [Salimicrobium salexigens]
MANDTRPPASSSTGLEENIGGLLTYLLGFITGIIFLLIEKESSFIRFHAMQSTIVFGGIFILGLVVGMIPLIGWLISLLISPVSLVLWVFLMYKAYNKERYHLPVIGDMAEGQVKKIK